MERSKKQSQSDSSSLNPDFQSSRQVVKSFKAKADETRTISEKLADGFTEIFGSMPFLTLNTLWFFVWIAINLNLVPAIKPFDPFPFGLLTMIVSLEAIILATFVLISQNRTEKIDDMREEVDLQIDITTEKEVTKLLELVTKLLEKNGVDLSDDQELKKMLLNISQEKIEKVLQKQMGSED